MKSPYLATFLLLFSVVGCDSTESKKENSSAATSADSVASPSVKGEKGEKGEAGEVGSKGEKGEQGSAGEKGEIGATGIAGADCSAELKADGVAITCGDNAAVTLPLAKDGVDGINGTSCTAEPAVNGVEIVCGKERIFVANGDKGDTGATGADGVKGDKGDTGAAGADGVKGDKGDTGATGADGAKGDTGLDGVKGDAGASCVGTKVPEGISIQCGSQAPIIIAYGRLLNGSFELANDRLNINENRYSRMNLSEKGYMATYGVLTETSDQLYFEPKVFECKSGSVKESKTVLQFEAYIEERRLAMIQDMASKISEKEQELADLVQGEKSLQSDKLGIDQEIASAKVERDALKVQVTAYEVQKEKAVAARKTQTDFEAGELASKKKIVSDLDASISSLTQKETAQKQSIAANDSALLKNAQDLSTINQELAINVNLFNAETAKLNAIIARKNSSNLSPEEKAIVDAEFAVSLKAVSDLNLEADQLNASKVSLGKKTIDLEALKVTLAQELSTIQSSLSSARTNRSTAVLHVGIAEYLLGQYKSKADAEQKKLTDMGDKSEALSAAVKLISDIEASLAAKVEEIKQKVSAISSKEGEISAIEIPKLAHQNHAPVKVQESFSSFSVTAGGLKLDDKDYGRTLKPVAGELMSCEGMATLVLSR